MLMSGKLCSLGMRVRQVEVVETNSAYYSGPPFANYIQLSLYITSHNNRNTEFTTLERLDNSQGENLSDVLHIRIWHIASFEGNHRKLFSRINLDCHRGSRVHVTNVLSENCLIFRVYTTLHVVIQCLFYFGVRFWGDCNLPNSVTIIFLFRVRNFRVYDIREVGVLIDDIREVFLKLVIIKGFTMDM